MCEPNNHMYMAVEVSVREEGIRPEAVAKTTTRGLIILCAKCGHTVPLPRPEVG